MPVDSVFGWRRDVAEALKALHPRIIRFGGTTVEGFDWTATIGDPAKSLACRLRPSGAGWSRATRAWKSSSSACRWAVRTVRSCVRFSGRTPKQAAEEVEYFNGPPATPMGGLRAERHPRLRRGDGRSATS